MKIDLHCHSIYSEDSTLEPETLINRAVELGLDGVCFTEHDSLSGSNPFINIVPPDGFVIFHGVEISTRYGHLLVYGLDDDSWNRWLRKRNTDLGKTVDIIHKLGGLCIPAHPYREGYESLGDRIFNNQGFDAIETHNGRNLDDENRIATRSAKLVNLPSIGGSDCHKKDQVGKAYTVFKNPVQTMDELLKEIKAGNCHGRSL